MLVALTAIAIVIGIAGTLLPFVPGIGLVWIAIVIYAVVDGFGGDALGVLIIVTVIGLVGIYAGFRMPQRAASDGGLDWRAQLVAAAFAVGGFFLIPVVGAPLGFVLGVYLMMQLANRTHALQATVATIKALLIASGIQFAAATIMGLIWAGWVLVGWVA